jgi:hypothetical protein
VELVALFLSLSNEEFEAGGLGPEDWSPRQLVEHLVQVDATYANNIRTAVEAARASTS